MNKILNYIKTHKVISAVAIVLILTGGYRWYQNAHGASGSVQYITAPAQNATITVATTASGQVAALNRVDIKPVGSGNLVAVDVKQGATVKFGQTLAVIDERTAALSVSQAQAGVDSAKAAYDTLIAGPTSTDLTVDQGPVQSAQASLDNAKTSYANIITTQNQAASKALTQLLNTDTTAIPSGGNSSTASIIITGQYAGTIQGQYVITIRSAGGGVFFNISGLETNSAISVTRGFAEALGTQGLFINFGTTGTLVSGDTWIVSLPNTASTNYLTNSNAYQAALQTQTQSLATAQQQIDSAQLNLTQAQASLSQKVAPPTAASLEAAQAQIQSAEGQLQSAQIAYSNNIIKAPFDGVIAALNNHIGDQVGSSTIIATIITQQQIAQLSLNEVDVSKIKFGDKAIMTFDALNGLSITGTVAEIDTIGTVTQGVVTYNVQIGFDVENSQVKPGMSVSAAIITDVAADVLAVPNSAVKSSSGGSYVQILDKNGAPQNVNVQSGISNDTLTEITSGLNAGDMVVTQIINPSAKTTTTTSAASGLRIPGLTGGAGGGGFGGGAGGATRGGAAGGAGTGAARGN